MGGLFLNKKGQIFSWDILIAMGIFVFIIIASIYMWDFYRERTDIIDLRADMEFDAQNAMISLVTTSGVPNDWYSYSEFNVSSFGLMIGNSYVLSEDKVSKIQEWNNTYYGEIKNSLGIRKYEMYLEIDDYEFGRESPISAQEVVKIERLAVLGGKVVKVILEVWDE